MHQAASAVAVGCLQKLHLHTRSKPVCITEQHTEHALLFFCIYGRQHVAGRVMA